MNRRVLSIQSHVAYGYVGGKAAVFPLQCLGYDVDVVNTVNFSNHSGYGRFGGPKASAQDLTTIFDTMDANDLLTQQRLLTGYIPGAETLSVVAKLVKKLKARNPEIIYLLDPVLGDSGRLYVAPDVIPIYRELLPQATIITPNWFEVETLTNVPIKDMSSLRTALTLLHNKYLVPHVVMSSIPLHGFLRLALPSQLLSESAMNGLAEDGSHLLCISSSSLSSSNVSIDHDASLHNANLSTVHAHTVPCIPGYFSGVGDLFSALVLAHFNPNRTSDSGSVQSSTFPTKQVNDAPHTPLSIATSLALSKTFALLKLTDEQVSTTANFSRTDDATDEERDRTDPERLVRRMRTRELRLIQGQDLLRSVPISMPDTGDIRTLQLHEMRPWSGFWTQASISTP
ncbi:Ribokinase-like protein [Fomitiporia mediterranea MF3/22]|uniref:Ribokinase-like protein n=1 Tax=Fomitiporia mediterranea (strain MF3/22) TaxID=694068 RepID=UPI00044096F3|nr:Ribokinase-like protein [Fomitiporia mediterranea MF3/22]EJD08541.1 Ribokinase-like protein [Fomitiporia mediterranea MF3/22]